MKRVIILGASGNIGQQSIEILRRFPNEFQLVGVSVGKNIKALQSMLQEFKSIEAYCTIEPLDDANRLHFFGDSGLIELVNKVECDLVINALVGSVGFKSSVTALELNRTLALANKESLVIGGFILKKLVSQGHGQIIPIDSEHTGLLKALKGRQNQEIKSVYITASGGAFRDYARDQLTNLTLTDALKHPTWQMGAKITIDSATMMNKVFEVIEAHYLFGIAPEKIKVILHRESVFHALVELTDGSFLAELSNPDMHRPILYALFSETIVPYEPSNLLDILGHLSFAPFDYTRFPLLELAYKILKTNPLLGAVINKANDLLVADFMAGRIRFSQIEEKLLQTFEYFDQSLRDYPLALDARSIDKLEYECEKYLRNKV